MSPRGGGEWGTFESVFGAFFTGFLDGRYDDKQASKQFHSREPVSFAYS